MEYFVAIAIVVICAVVYQNFFDGTSKPPQRTPEEEAETDRLIAARLAVWETLTEKKVKNMTLHAIQTKIGNGCEPWMVMTHLSRRKWECADFDGTISSEERRHRENTIGTKNLRLICPHCQEKGGVFKKTNVNRYQDTRNTSNVTAAIMSGKHTTTRKVTQLHCVKCDTTWDI